MHSQLTRSHRALAALLALLAALALALAGAAHGAVRLPVPGAMTVGDLPASVRAGHTFTLREVLPLAVWHGAIVLQGQGADGAWRTLTTAPLRPRIAWLHWRVAADLAGQSLTVRFLLESSGQMLARSPSYPLAIAGGAP